jgi:hypothetical protein
MQKHSQSSEVCVFVCSTIKSSQSIFFEQNCFHPLPLQKSSNSNVSTIKSSQEVIKTSKTNIKMCITKIRTHLCGERLPHNRMWHCAHKNQADLLEISLESPGRLPVPLLRYEIGRLRALCEAEKREEHFCNFYQGCAACAKTSESLGPAEAARRLTTG